MKSVFIQFITDHCGSNSCVLRHCLRSCCHFGQKFWLAVKVGDDEWWSTFMDWKRNAFRFNVGSASLVTKTIFFPSLVFFADEFWKTEAKKTFKRKIIQKRLLLATIVLARRKGCVAQRKHFCFPPSSPGYESQLCCDFISLLLSRWTVLRSNPSSSAMQWILQMQ